MRASPPPTGPDAMTRTSRIEDVYPLTPMQEGMLFHSLYEAGAGAYVGQLGLEIEGALDVEAFRAAWQRVVDRHPALRTDFVWEGVEKPVQAVRRRAALPMTELDWRGMPAHEQAERLDAWLRDDLASGIDPARAPLMRLTLFRTAERVWQLVWTHHHLALDGWSLPRVFREVVALYAARRAGLDAALPPARPYAAYAAWLRRRSPAAAERFWARELAGFGAATPLEMGQARPGAAGHGRARLRLSAEGSVALRALARRERLTLNTVVQGAWALLLSRYAGENDVVFGATVSGRPAELEGVEEIVGLFINTLPVRVRVDEGERLLPWLRRLQERQVEMREHEHSALPQIQRWSGVPAGQRLFDSILVFQNYPVGDAPGTGRAGLAVRRWADRGGEGGAISHTGYPLALVGSLDGELALYAEYERGRFAAGAVERMLEHLARLLEGMALADGETRLAGLPLLSAAERSELLIARNGTAADFPADTTIHALIAAQAARTPSTPAAAGEGESLDYAELERRSNQLAHALRRRGVGAEVRVALMLERGVDLAVAVLGVLKAGGAYVPLDPALPPERLAYLLEDSGARVLIAHEALLPRLDAPFSADVLPLDVERDRIAREREDAPVVDVDPRSLAYVIYTSGSTGRPKGVGVEHRSLVAYATEMARQMGLGPGERILQFASPGFDVVVEELFPAWVSGAAVVFSREDLFSPWALNRVVEDEGVTVFELPTAYWHEWVAETSASGALPGPLRRVIVGGERVLPDRLRAWAGLNLPLIHVFGLTETTVTTTTLHLPAGADGAEWGPNLPIGAPVANQRVYVLDARGEPAPEGVAGELFIGGAGVARGYLGRAALTAERYVPDPFPEEPGARLYRTGDRVRWLDGGAVEFLGRADQQVKVRGYRIEPAEIEAVLAEHGAVREAAVILREDAPGDRRLVAYVVSANGRDPEAAELREHLKSRLPEYMVPAAFVALGALPLTPNGKLDRRALPAPDAGDLASAEHVAPRTPDEQTLAAIWAAVLHRDRVGVHDDFFQSGGDSILSIQIVSRARKAGLHITPRQVFEHPTIAGLARVAAAGDGRTVEAEQGIVTGPAPLTPIQHWFFARDVPDRHHWNLAFLLQARGPLDPAALERAVAHVLAHHDALRMRFRPDGGGWTQENAGVDDTPAVARLDLSATPGDALADAIARAAADAQQTLDLEHGPLLRVLLIDVGAGRAARLLVAAHHLVTDGVSWRVLLEDLQTAYGQATRGERILLPPKTTSFRVWARRLAAHAAEGAFDAELPYWTDEARRGVVSLPVDRPGATDTTSSSRRVPLVLDEAETAALLEEVPRAYRTQVNDVLLAALARALAEWTGDARMLVEMEGHGREEIFAGVDLSRTAGWFTTLFPVLLDLRGADGPGGALKAVKEQLRAVPGRGLGHGALRWLSPRAEVRSALAAMPAAEVRFEYQGQLDGTLSGTDALFAPAPEPAGPRGSGGEPRSHRLVVNGAVVEGRLRMSIGYGANAHDAATVERLAERYAAELRALIAHCRAAAPGLTPSDVPLAGLDQAALDGLLAADGVVEDVYPLTPMQEGMLFHTLYEPAAGAYVGQLTFRLDGALDVEAFRRAWELAVRRHAALRHRFAWDGLDRPLQVVRARVELPFHAEDWRGAGEREREARLEAYLRDDRARGFDPARPPLMRLALFRTGEAEHRFTWSFHQMVLDGWSLPLVFRDVVAAYDAGTAGRAAPSGAARPFRDYVAWLRSRDAAGTERFWREALAGFPAPTPLGVDRYTGEAGYGRETLRLSPRATAAVQGLAREHGLTAGTVLQGAWAILLSRYAGEDDVVFGTTVSGRPAELEGVETMVGLFINTLPLRVRVDASLGVVSWLRALQARQVALREHEHAPLAQVQRWSEVPAGQPLFETNLVFENYPAPDALGGGERALRVRALEGREQANYPLTVSAALATELELRAMYSRARLDAAAVGRMLRHLATVLEAMAAAPDALLSTLALVTEDERRTLLAAGAARATFPAARGIHARFAEQAARTPDAPAITFEGRSLTYAELDGRSNQLARRLRSMGVEPDVRVGLCLERGPEMVIAILGVLKAGGAYVPLDPAYPADRLAFVLEDAGISVLLTQSSVHASLPAFDGTTLLLDTASAELERESTDAIEVDVDPASLWDPLESTCRHASLSIL